MRETKLWAPMLLVIIDLKYKNDIQKENKKIAQCIYQELASPCLPSKPAITASHPAEEDLWKTTSHQIYNTTQHAHSGRYLKLCSQVTRHLIL